jgi:hypothetical protein
MHDPFLVRRRHTASRLCRVVDRLAHGYRTAPNVLAQRLSFQQLRN